MKRDKIFTIILPLAIFLAGISTVNSSAGEISDYPLFEDRYNFQRQLELTMAQEWKDFISQYGNMYRVAWNELTETPTSVIGPGIYLQGAVTKSSVENLTRAFIADHEELLGVSLTDLDLLNADEHQGSWEVTYQQEYEGLSVYSGMVGMSITSEDKVIMFRSDFYAGIDLSTTPTLSGEEAIDIAKAQVNFNPETDSLLGEPALLILPDIGSDTLFYHLAYRVKLFAADPLGNWVYFIDGHNGEVVCFYNDLRFYDIYGTVTGTYTETPVMTSPPFTAPFANHIVTIESDSLGFSATTFTDEDGYYSVSVPSAGTYTVTSQLKGYDHDTSYVRVKDKQEGYLVHTGLASTSSPHDWTWGIDGRYDDPNAYYHITNFYNYISGEPFNCREMLYPLLVIVNYRWLYQAYYDPETECIFIGEGYEDRVRDLALSSDVILHEYTHALVYHISHMPNGPGHSKAIQEGLAHYFPATLSDDPVLYEDVCVYQNLCIPPLLERCLENDLTYPDDYTGGCHHDGQILGGALWDLREMLGEPVNTDKLVYDATCGIPDIPIYFEHYFNRILLADDKIANGGNDNPADGTPHIEQIYHAFYLNHGIGPGKYIQPGGHITQNTLWGPYDSIFVAGDVIVDPGVTLTIGHGSSINFWPNHDEQKWGVDTSRCELIIEGELVISGTGTDSVVLSSTVGGAWYGVRFKPRSQGQIAGAILENGHCGVFMDTASVVTIEGNSIRGNEMYGLTCHHTASATAISGNTISGNNDYGIYTEDCSPYIIGNDFPYPEHDYAIKAVRDYPDSVMVIRGNTISMPVLECGKIGEGPRGIYIEYASPQIVDNVIVGGAYGIFGVGLDSTTAIKGGSPPKQILDRNVVGLALYSGSRPIVSANQIIDYRDRGVICDESYPLLGNSLIPGTGSNIITTSDPCAQYAVYCEGVTDTIKAEMNWWGEVTTGFLLVLWASGL